MSNEDWEVIRERPPQKPYKALIAELFAQIDSSIESEKKVRPERSLKPCDETVFEPRDKQDPD